MVCNPADFYDSWLIKMRLHGLAVIKLEQKKIVAAFVKRKKNSYYFDILIAAFWFSDLLF